MTDTPRRPNTALLRQCADGHRTLSGMYALDPTPDAAVTAQGSLMTALFLEAAADFIDAVPVPDVTNRPDHTAECVTCRRFIEDCECTFERKADAPTS